MASAILNCDTLAHVNLTDDQFSFFAFVKYNSASFLAFLDVNRYGVYVISSLRPDPRSIIYSGQISPLKSNSRG